MLTIRNQRVAVAKHGFSQRGLQVNGSEPERRPSKTASRRGSKEGPSARSAAGIVISG